MLAWIGGGALVLVLLYAGLRWFVTARPGDLATAARTFLAVFSVLASTGLIFTGRFGLAFITIAATVMAVRALVLGRRGADPIGEPGETDGDQAAVETTMLAMQLDRRTGRIEGSVRTGVHRGRNRCPGWACPPCSSCWRRPGATIRPRWTCSRPISTAASPPGAPAAPPAPHRRRRPPWTRPRRCEILGLAAGATPDEIRAAHRRLMARLHPDHGGST